MLKIKISATFTPEPIQKSMLFWAEQFGLDLDLVFAPYNQVFQQLLHPNTCLAQDEQAVNLFLICLEDWAHIRHEAKSQATRPSLKGINTKISDVNDLLQKTVQEFVQALKAKVPSNSSAHVVMFCPPAFVDMKDTEHYSLARVFQEVEQQIIEDLHSIANLYFITSSELQQHYPVKEYYDPYGDDSAHIPFTDECFTALGTMAMRKIVSLQRPPYKVIVLDCDHTLWQGVCGEEGTDIAIEGPYYSLQMFMRQQYEAGMLLCLCSKNHEEDVLNVFAKRRDMPLTLEQMVAWRINWKSKSENIKTLAKELNLGLESFIFVDDSPIECAEMRAHCPEVLTVQLPTDVSSIPHVLDHVWAFDHVKVTQEDTKRTLQYQQNIKREQARQRTDSLEDFLATLQLSIRISPMKTNQVPRVSQLTQRTNQFNFTTRRRTEGEIQQWVDNKGQHLLVVEVSDRFGDYGLVGAILYSVGSKHLEVDTLLLSCRVLGRGVEHRMFEKLGEIAKEHGLKTVQAVYKPTRKNQPAFNFLRSLATITNEYLPPYSETLNREDEIFSTFSVNTLEAISPLAIVGTVQESQEDIALTPNNLKKESDQNVLRPNQKLADYSRVLRWISEEMSSAKKIHQCIETRKSPRPALQQAYVRARTKTERLLRSIWLEALNLEDVGMNDSLEDLGGSSLQVVQIHSRLAKLFSLADSLTTRVPVTMLFQYPTIRTLANFIEQGNKDQQNFADSVRSRAALQQSAFFRQRELRKTTKTPGRHNYLIENKAL